MMTEIRIAEKQDIEPILVLDPLSSDPIRRQIIDTATARGHCYVSCLGSEIVGYGIVKHDFFGRGFIELVVVSLNHRRQGFGPLLVSRLERESQSATIFTSTNEPNIGMQNLLITLGYRRSGIIENLDADDPELIYCKNVARYS